MQKGSIHIYEASSDKGIINDFRNKELTVKCSKKFGGKQVHYYSLQCISSNPIVLCGEKQMCNNIKNAATESFLIGLH